MAYFSAEHLVWLRERGLVARIARPGVESGERNGRHPWKIEPSTAWLFDHRRHTVRYERKGSHFLDLAAPLTCWGFAKTRHVRHPLKCWIVGEDAARQTVRRSCPLCALHLQFER
ncbi:hypothetical protein [Streptomyces sp. NPDC088746]|uniref:hypothetical protein n=1 Tax=Streptomyces sp. NPDC088746 TaxID=3365885 RepID=UPI0038147F9C